MNGCDMRTRFFDEAKRLLDNENGRVSLTTAQALFIMHLSAAATGTDRAARMYLLAACDMVQRPKVLSDGSTGGGGEGGPAKHQGRHRQIMSRALWGMYCFERLVNTASRDLITRNRRFGRLVDTAFRIAFSPLRTFDRPSSQSRRSRGYSSTKPP